MNRAIDYLASLKVKIGQNGSFYEDVYDNLKIKHCEVSGNSSKVLIELPLLPQMINILGNLDTGAIMTFIDQLSTIAIAIVDDRYNVSVDLSTNFISQVSKVKMLEFEITCHNVGRRLAFTSTEIRADGKVIARGAHTKSMINLKWTNYKL
ncbi:hypothetical protein SteCoe_16179 [Stentor coeruleus]|uniref:Thioesterase domain-containing protein n=1 Tax=Stentor coeruleus TaxID=5963 RepID=A0A1R2C1Z4_9CILI|nr:hypothetical protein SteCoe_16179 [Stentor coeruleus]